MALIFYARVSSSDQNLSRQLERAKQVHADRIFADKISGKSLKRPQFERMMKFIREGDTVEVLSLDRLSRNYNDLKSLIMKFRQMGVTFISDDLPELHTGNELLDNAMLDLFITMLSFVAQNEREKIRERQAEGIALAKKAGKYKGGTVKYSPDSKHPQYVLVWKNVVKMLKSKKYSISEIARQSGISRVQVYRIKNRLPQYEKEADEIKA